MNIQLDRVLADITGTTGMAILRAIVAGERDPLVLAQLRNPGCKSSEEKLAKAMQGTWQAPYLFVMRQALSCTTSTPSSWPPVMWSLSAPTVL